MTKQRLSASVDAELLEAAHRAVRDGRAESVSAWVSDALRRQVEHDARRRAADTFFADFEREHGEIGPEEIAAARQRADERAVTSDDQLRPSTRRASGRAGSAKRARGAA